MEEVEGRRVCKEIEQLRIFSYNTFVHREGDNLIPEVFFPRKETRQERQRSGERKRLFMFSLSLLASIFAALLLESLPRLMHLSMLSPREGGPAKGLGFDFFGEIFGQIPHSWDLGIEIWVKLNQIPLPRTISSESAYVFMDHLGPRLRSNSREWGSQERSNAPHLPGLNIDNNG